MEKKRLPVGVDRFEKIIERGYYYLDKTMFIKDLLDSVGEVNLFTRPRRFGKTLNMSMLKAFFEIGTDRSLFEGTKIAGEKELCEAYHGQYPVVFLSLKSVDGEKYEDALSMLAYLISNECIRLRCLEDGNVPAQDVPVFDRLSRREASETELKSSLATLMRMLYTHYGKQVILLIDEYDVPLDKASTRGYYDRMVSFLRNFFGEAFKTNPDLYFAVLTGCLRISKESIFTGVNNLKVDTIQDERFDEFFGFTDADVQKILTDYGESYAYDDMRQWYDGYRFGKADVYCPWDVICHCDKLLESPDAEPRLYWNNTSSNALVRQFIDIADATTRSDIERLIAGEVIERRLIENLTYEEITDKIEHLWSVLYLTGYLMLDREQKASQRGYARFRIPNREVRESFIEKIQGWFEEKTDREHTSDELYDAIWTCHAEDLQEKLRNILYDTISYHDYHENYYHALMVGLLLDKSYCVRSNREMGSGRSDIVVEDDRNRRVVIIETKRSKAYDDLEQDSAKALQQIQRKEYDWPYQKRRYAVFYYGIAFYEKDCHVTAERAK